jgi:hypothetical protein
MGYARSSLSSRGREAVELPDAIRREHFHGVDVLIDLVNDGAAVSTRYAADEEGPRAKGIAGINFNLAAQMTSELLERLAEAVADRGIVSPPIRRISLDEGPATFNPAPPSNRPRQDRDRCECALVSRRGRPRCPEPGRAPRTILAGGSGTPKSVSWVSHVLSFPTPLKMARASLRPNPIPRKMWFWPHQATPVGAAEK